MTKIISITSICLLFVLLNTEYTRARTVSNSNSVHIENNVSSSSNTGGNSGDSISTGDAESKSRVEVKSSGDKSKVKVDAKAKANDIEKEVLIEEVSGDGSVSEEVSVTDLIFLNLFFFLREREASVSLVTCCKQHSSTSKPTTVN